MSKRSALVGLSVLVVVGFISLRHYFSPGEVVKRKFIATIEAFEKEQLLAVMAGISRGYSDPWGLKYETLAGYLNETVETYDDLDVDSLLSEPVVGEGEVRIDIQFVVWGRYEGTKGYVVGSITEPCTATVLWREEKTGWRFASTEELDIPELRSQMDSKRKN
ncbi:MAG: hypothetical protein OEV48_03115 [Acidobacteriota bacterium]|jgi:hypothetical protein|nr:hypothetical protein [Acidobacteriota bacterium]